MQVPARIYATENMIEAIRNDNAPEQAANVAHLQLRIGPPPISQAVPPHRDNGPHDPTRFYRVQAVGFNDQPGDGAASSGSGYSVTAIVTMSR